MPRGKSVNHKGRNRHFTNPEELEAERKKNENERFESGTETDELSSADEPESGCDSEGEDNAKAKGVSGLIEVDNPNRIRIAAQKVNLDVKPSGCDSARGHSTKSELSRRERETLHMQRSKHTDRNCADLARLAIIKQQRTEAAARKDAEKKKKEDQKKPADK